MDPLLPVMSFLSLALVSILLVLYFAVQRESPTLDFWNTNKNFDSRYVVGPEIF